MQKVMLPRDIVFMNLTAIIRLQWLPIAAGYGASAITLWILAALFFFIPMGFVSTELATAMPDQGGLYVWVKKAYGERLAFIVSWFYWITNFFWVTGFLTFVAVNLAAVINPALANNKIFICSTVLVILWSLTLMNFKSMLFVKRFANLSGIFGTLLPGLIIMLLGFAVVFIWKLPIPTDYSLANFWPDFGANSNIAFLSTLMFAMAGIELTPILAGETKDPHKTYPKATLITAFFVVVTYVVGTMAITWMIPPDKIGSASGIMDALYWIANQLHVSYLAKILALMILVGCLGGVSIWILVPLKMFFESIKDGVLPRYFTKLNKNYMPAHALVIQAIVMSIIVIGTSLLSSVNVFYETLVIMTTTTYFLPYIFMFIIFIKLRYKHPEMIRPYRVPYGNKVAWVIASCGFLSVLLAIVLPFIIPPKDLITSFDVMMYRGEIAGGTLIFFVIGYSIYRSYELRKRRALKKV